MPVETDRPTPEQFLHLIRRQERGRLKVYVGSSAGVGKTYAMLRDGARLKKQGVDVAIGLVETHGRAETAEQIGDLELIPPRTIEYRGVTLREMDLDVILARRPTVCLVDELAHTNAPGGKHAKRYQDVEDLLRGGIHVITTVNIQHLESLYDEVERATGVKVKERLPDHVLAEADQVVNIDVSTEDLLERLKAGKVYPPERAERALANFFTPANLTRLREITLSELAHLIDRRAVATSVGTRPITGGRSRDGWPFESRPERASAVAPRCTAGGSLECALVRRLHSNARRRPHPRRRRDATRADDES